MKTFVIRQMIRDIETYEVQASSRAEAIHKHMEGLSTLVSGPSFLTSDMEIAAEEGMALDEHADADILDYFSNVDGHDAVLRQRRLPAIESIVEKSPKQLLPNVDDYTISRIESVFIEGLPDSDVTAGFSVPLSIGRIIAEFACKFIDELRGGVAVLEESDSSSGPTAISIEGFPLISAYSLLGTLSWAKHESKEKPDELFIVHFRKKAVLDQ